MNVPTHDTCGMAIFRELTLREGRSVGRWEQKFSAEALKKPIDPKRMVNLAEFDSTFSTPVPLSVQLEMLRDKRAQQRAEISRFESANYPHKSTHPVSQASVGLYREKAWHTQPQTKPAQAKNRPQTANPTGSHARRVWNADRTDFNMRATTPPNPPPLIVDQERMSKRVPDWWG